jgi:hypothetical protein
VFGVIGHLVKLLGELLVQLFNHLTIANLDNDFAVLAKFSEGHSRGAP